MGLVGPGDGGCDQSDNDNRATANSLRIAMRWPLLHRRRFDDLLKKLSELSIFRRFLDVARLFFRALVFGGFRHHPTS